MKTASARGKSILVVMIVLFLAALLRERRKPNEQKNFTEEMSWRGL